MDEVDLTWRERLAAWWFSLRWNFCHWLIEDISTLRSNHQDVHAFMEKFDLGAKTEVTHVSKDVLDWRFKLMDEELNEFASAAATQDMAKMADALIDLAYVTHGTALVMGLPWEDLWDDVHCCNMAKVRGTSHRGVGGPDVIKPPGWDGPMTEWVLEEHGYDIKRWFTYDEERGEFTINKELLHGPQ